MENWKIFLQNKSKQLRDSLWDLNLYDKSPTAHPQLQKKKNFFHFQWKSLDADGIMKL